MKTVTEAVRSVPLRSLLTGFLPAVAAFLLSGAALDGLYSPWALAAVSAAGVSWPGLSALLGAGLGAFLFLDFQAGCATPPPPSSSSVPTRRSAPPACTAVRYSGLWLPC